MERGFFRSREFAISFAIAVLVVAGAAGALGYLAANPPLHVSEGCRVETPATEVLESEVSDTGAVPDGDAWRRTITFTVDPGDLAGGDLRICADIGSVVVRPSADGAARVAFSYRAQGIGAERAIAENEGAAVFARSGGGLVLAAWQPRMAYVENLLGSASHSMRVEVEVPATGPYALATSTRVGETEVRDLDLDAASVKTGVGDIRLSDVALHDALDVRTEVGRVNLAPAGFAPGDIRIRTEVGDVDVRLPQLADVGYHVSARTGVGALVLDLGEGATHAIDRSAPGATGTSRSQDYDSKLTQVKLDVEVDVGGIDVRTR